MRKGELAQLTVDAVVQIGSAYWLRIPISKLHTDRYIPLHPQLKALLDSWLTTRPEDLRSQLMFTERGRPLSAARINAAVDKVARAAGIGHVHPHQLRHTLATQAINRGMSLEALGLTRPTSDSPCSRCKAATTLASAQSAPLSAL
jgi:integrase